MKNNTPVCVIIGAGDYIGAAIARRFAAGGFIVCLGRRTGEKNDALVAEIDTAGGQLHIGCTRRNSDSRTFRLH